MNKHSVRVVDVVGILVCTALVLALVPRSILKRRSQARSAACMNNMKQIGIAFHNYHSAYKQLPAGTGGTTGNQDPAKSNQGFVGPLIGILPFCEQQALWEQISNPYRNEQGGVEFPSMGPVPSYDASKYEPWGKGPDVYRCPDVHPVDPQEANRVIYSLELPGGGIGATASYVASYGDGTVLQGKVVAGQVDAESARRRQVSNRGAFMTSQSTKFRDFLDGLSNTVFFSEVVSSELRKPGVSEIIRDVNGLDKNPSLCLRQADAAGIQFWEFGRGARWSDGRPVYSGFQTVLPPNSPSCTSEQGIDEPIVSASSLHERGVHVLMADGAVVFISDSIDAGDPTKPGIGIGPQYTQPGMRSPYGLWGAIGSRAARETIEEMLSEPDSGRNYQTTRPGRVSVGRVSRDKGVLWTDKNTKAKLTAELIEIRDKKTVRLRHSSGTVHEVPLNSLIPADIYRAIEIDLMRRAASNK